jgi:dihydropyrimidine dehydrogenase (NAD+) subunit PreA
MEEKGFKKLEDFIGAAVNNVVSADKLDRNYIIYPKFDEDRCIGCGRCYISCFDGGHQAINWISKDRKPVLNRNKCIGCHLCAAVCPINCISSGEILYK